MKTAALGGCFCFAACRRMTAHDAAPPPSVSFRCRELSHCAHGALGNCSSRCPRRPRKLRSEKLRTSETAHDSCAPVRTSPTETALPVARRPRKLPTEAAHGNCASRCTSPRLRIFRRAQYFFGISLDKIRTPWYNSLKPNKGCYNRSGCARRWLRRTLSEPSNLIRVMPA